MSKLFIIFSLLLLIFVSMIQIEKSKEDDYILLADKVRNDAVKEIMREYNVIPSGIYDGLVDCVQLSGVAFQYRKITTRNEAREMIISMIKKYLSEFNKNETIRPYLVNFPFCVENIRITVFIYDEKGKDVNDPYLSVVTTHDGKIYYRTDDPNDKFNFKNEYEETYEEALAIVQSQ